MSGSISVNKSIELSLGLVGPQGVPGPTGPAGPVGPQAPISGGGASSIYTQDQLIDGGMAGSF